MTDTQILILTFLGGMIAIVVAQGIIYTIYGWFMYRHPGPRWGCCGCGAKIGDLAIKDKETGELIESYCWSCYDRPTRNPEDDAEFKSYPIQVWEGHER
jgi:hypothetical protein